MGFLCEVGGKDDGVAAGSAGRNADRQTADLPGCGKVAFEQGRRELAYRNIVEAVAGIVARQER